ncbi:hypothetical protein BGZ94_010030 [Podila epigama]|nr:hypothetical protein BGZ94_010030 [Podila epigama]
MSAAIASSTKATFHVLRAPLQATIRRHYAATTPTPTRIPTPSPTPTPNPAPIQNNSEPSGYKAAKIILGISIGIAAIAEGKFYYNLFFRKTSETDAQGQVYANENK